MSLACTRGWEVEAVLDGRLTGAERAGWERHRETCAYCAREWQALSRLRELARATAAPERSPLASRRARGRLLELADANATGRHRAASARPVWGVALAFAVICGIAVFFTHRKIGTQPSIARSAVMVEPSTDARWTDRRDGVRRRIHIEEGTLALRLDHADVIVSTPDGEIEDTGTAFSVTVSAGHTERVSVSEGSVIVRLASRAPFSLGAGASWAAEHPIAIAPVLVAPRAVDVAPARDAGPRMAVRPATATVVAAASASSAPLASPPAAADDPATRELAAAMKTMAEGRLAEAASLFQAFERAHAGDPKAEDAAYLRVVVLDRAGRHNAARVAAREYVTRHPNGFRRKELEALADDAARP